MDPNRSDGVPVMQSGDAFVDFYALLQVDSTCDATILEKAYRHFAHMYHPDHAETADVTKFQEVISAYKVLRDPEKRAEYDALYKAHRKTNFFEFVQHEDLHLSEKSAIADAEEHEKMLFYLYKRRREHADDPGIMAYHLQKLIDCSDESFEFHIWYLKSKGFIQATEDATLEITIEGVDHVISMSRATQAEKLLIPKKERGDEPE